MLHRLGGALGVMLAWFALKGAVTAIPAEIPRAADASLDMPMNPTTARAYRGGNAIG